LSWPVASFLVVGMVLLVGWLAYERARPSARMVAVVGTLAAAAALGRDAFVALPDVKPITALTFVVGYALGPLPGFTVGAVGMLASNILLGQGPYTPWQMAAWGLVGLAGAMLGRLSGRRLRRLSLACGCALSALGAKEIMDLYTWVIGASHTSAAFLVVEGQALPFDIVDTAASFCFGLAFAPELARLLARVRSRMDVTWEPLGGEAGASLTTKASVPLTTVLALLVGVGVGIGALSSPGIGTAQAAIALAASPRAAAARLDIAHELGFIAAAQNTDGGFGGARGQSSNELDSAWVAMGLAAAGRNPQGVRRGGHSVLDAIRGEASTLEGAGDLERTILALDACGVSPSSLGGSDPVTALLHSRAHDGSFEDLVNITAFAVFALRAAGRSSHDPVISAAARWIAGQQDTDGGFGFAGHSAKSRGGPSDVDDTAAALQALVAGGVRKGGVVTRAVAFLVGAQNPDGGYPQESGDQSNAQSTSWAIQGLIAAGRNPGTIRRDHSRTPTAYLESLLAPDGSVRYSRTSSQTPVWVTAQALTALAGKPFPIAPVRASTGKRASANVKRRLYPVGTMSNSAATTTVERALGAALLCLLGLAGTWILAAMVPLTHTQDAVALRDFTELGRARIDVLGNDLLHLLSPMPFIVWGLGMVAVALRRRRPRVALAVVGVLSLAPLTAEILKPLLAYPHVQLSWQPVVAASWPSGHSTAAMSLVLCAVLVVPRWLRPAVAAVGALFAVVVGFALLVLAWHMPSDVFGGYLVAAFWMSVAIAALRFSEARWPAREQAARVAAPPRIAVRSTPTFKPGGERLLAMLGAGALALMATVVVLLRAHHLEALADHRALIVAAAGITMLAVLICSTVTAALRR
jgi:membrane-associated phospholipid phosphatase